MEKRIKKRRQITPLMNSFADRFRTFLDDLVADGSFRYLVPVESKGAVIFDSHYAPPTQQTLFRPVVLYPRAFDFLPAAEISGQSCAVIDDCIFSGRTIRRVKARLAERGLDVRTYAFAKDCTPTRPDERDEATRDATPAAQNLNDQHTYERYILEMRELSTRQRIPAAYDHVVFRFPLETDRLSGLLARLDEQTTLLSYGVRSGQHAWTALLDETWLGDVAAMAPAVPPKVRLWWDGRTLSVVPMWQPAQTSDCSGNAFAAIIRSTYQDENAKKRDQLDALSFAGRTRILATLSHLLPELADAAPDRTHLDRTFTPTLGGRIEQCLRTELAATPPTFPSRGTRSSQPRDGFSYLSLARHIQSLVREAYEQQAVPRYRRESRGFTVHELITELPASPDEIHAAVDFLIDGGYLTTFYGQSRTQMFARALRGTEEGAALATAFPIEKAVAALCYLARDQRVSSTEVAKLHPILDHYFQAPIEGCSTSRGPGGAITTHAWPDGPASTNSDHRDTSDIDALLQGSKILVYRQKHFELNLETCPDSAITRDPWFEHEWVRLQAIANIVHNAADPLTPAKRATLISTIGSMRRGLPLLATDAAIIASNYRNALVKSNRSYVRAMGRAHKEGLNKIRLLREAREFGQRFVHSSTNPWENRLASQFQDMIPTRWTGLLNLWEWYLETLYTTGKRAIAERDDDATLVAHLRDAWRLGHQPSAPRFLCDDGVRWRRALALDGISESPDSLSTTIASEPQRYAHYDLAKSANQTTDRDRWFRGSANVIHDYAHLFECGRSSTRETQAESGFIWSQGTEKLLAAAAWACYSLYVLSEIEKPRWEWIPIFCLCEDDPSTDGIGQAMAASAKVTKGISREGAESVAQRIREYRTDSLDDRVFVLGKGLADEIATVYNGILVDRSDYAEHLGLKQPLATVRLDAYLNEFIRKLPRMTPP